METCKFCSDWTDDGIKFDGKPSCKLCFKKNKDHYILSYRYSSVEQWKKGNTNIPLSFSVKKMKNFKSLKNILKVFKGDELKYISLIYPEKRTIFDNDVDPEEVRILYPLNKKYLRSFCLCLSFNDDKQKQKRLHINVFPTLSGASCHVYISNGFYFSEKNKSYEYWDDNDYPELITKKFVKYCKIFYHTIMNIYFTSMIFSEIKSKSHPNYLKWKDSIKKVHEIIEIIEKKYNIFALGSLMDTLNDPICCNTPEAKKGKEYLKYYNDNAYKYNYLER